MQHPAVVAEEAAVEGLVAAEEQPQVAEHERTPVVLLGPALVQLAPESQQTEQLERTQIRMATLPVRTETLAEPQERAPARSNSRINGALRPLRVKLAVRRKAKLEAL